MWMAVIANFCLCVFIAYVSCCICYISFSFFGNEHLLGKTCMMFYCLLLVKLLHCELLSVVQETLQQLAAVNVRLYMLRCAEHVAYQWRESVSSANATISVISCGKCVYEKNL